MSNNAVVTWDTGENAIGVYIHWNGSLTSIKAFLAYCELKGYRKPDEDCYGLARFTQIVANFFGGIHSIGVGLVNTFGSCDNGIYICKGWNIIGHKGNPAKEDEYSLEHFLYEINNNQPKNEQISKEKIKRFINNEMNKNS